MVTKKSLLFTLGLFVITVLIWGFATPALSETAKCKCEGKATGLKRLNDSPGNSIGSSEAEGSCTCDDGETYTFNELYVFDLSMGMGKVFAHAYGVCSYKDNSKIVYTYKSLPLSFDPTREALLIFEGTSEIVRGTMRFNGIKGGQSFKGKQFVDGRQVIETISTYTLPLSKAKAADTELFIHKSPDFTLTVPKDWIKSDKSQNPDCVLRKDLDFRGTTTFEVVVSNLPDGKAYKDLAKDAITYVQDKFKTSNCQTLYEREIKLKDGTPAYEYEMKWNPMILLYTYRVVVFKDKKLIGISVTDTNQVSDQLKQIPLSLTLK